MEHANLCVGVESARKCGLHMMIVQIEQYLMVSNL